MMQKLTSKSTYANEITECKVNILRILEESEKNAISSTNMLNAQTETLNEIDNKLDTIHEELTMSDKIVRNMMGFLTFFPKKIFKKVQPVYGTKKNTNTVKDTLHNPNQYTVYKDEYYDEVQEYLNRLKQRALIHREILSGHSVIIDNISKKTDNVSQNIKIIESNMRKI